MDPSALALAFPIALSAYVLMLVHDTLRPVRTQGSKVGWRVRGVLSFLVAGMTFNVVGIFFDPSGSQSLFHVRQLGFAPAALIGFVVTNFFGYWWHRARHANDTLFRLTHQMHHSAETFDAYGSFYFHPVDTLTVAILVNTVSHVVLGVGLDVGLLLGAIGLAYTGFTHANVRTPRFLGYFINRPENHSLHHERGVHGRNYSDLPLWDLVFGTFENANERAGSYGYWDGASAQIGAMLTFRDVTTPQLAEAPVEAPVL